MAFFLAAFATIFSAVDPIALVPVYIVLTRGLDPAHRNRTIMRASIVGGLTLLVFAAIGRVLLDLLGITLPAFSIAGGILLLLIAIDMLFGRQSRTRGTPEETSEPQRSSDISVFPLGIPMIAGPGALAAVVLYMSAAGTNVMKIGAVVLSITIAIVASLVSMRLGTAVLRVLGETGIHVIGRVMGMILAALAVQFVLNGIGSYYHSLVH